MFKTVDSVLKRFPNKRGIGAVVSTLRTRDVVKEVLNGYFGDYGEEVVKQIKVLSVNRGFVRVGAPNLLALEIKTSEEKLLKKINSRLGAKTIFGIRTKVS